MPTYIYRCPTCGHPDVEYRHGMSEDPEFLCDECLRPLRRVPCPTAIEFRGKGFYTTDTRKVS